MIEITYIDMPDQVEANLLDLLDESIDLYFEMGMGIEHLLTIPRTLTLPEGRIIYAHHIYAQHKVGVFIRDLYHHLFKELADGEYD